MQGKISSTNNSCHLYLKVSETPNTVHHPLTHTIFWRLLLVMGGEEKAGKKRNSKRFGSTSEDLKLFRMSRYCLHVGQWMVFCNHILFVWKFSWFIVENSKIIYIGKVYISKGCEHMKIILIEPVHGQWSYGVLNSLSVFPSLPSFFQYRRSLGKCIW